MKSLKTKFLVTIELVIVLGLGIFIQPNVSLASVCSDTGLSGQNCCNNFPSDPVCIDFKNSGGSSGGGTTGGGGGGSGSGSVICDTANGFELTSGGVCVPKSPFGGGVASKKTLAELVSEVLKILLTLSGVVAVVFIVLGGFRYMTANGNEEQAEKGRKSLINAIIGLAIIILAYTLVSVIVNGLTSGNILGN